MTKHRMSRETTSKRLRARYLVVVKGYSQKEAAKIVGTTEKTMTAWSKRYNWKDEMSKLIKKEGGLNGFMEQFFEYLRSAEPAQANTTKTSWYNFLKSYEKQIEKSVLE